MDSMNIKKIVLFNYRGARYLPLDMDPRLNVFVGVNGAGKSTVLDASAILLSWAVNRIKSSGASGRPISEADIANGQSVTMLDMIIAHGDPEVDWRLVKSRKGHSKGHGHSILTRLNQYTNHWQSQISDENEQVNLPLIVYYPVNRAVLDIPLRIKEKHRFNLLATYEDALTSGANFRIFFEWFREREDLENENRKYADSLIKPEGFQFPDPQLEAVRKALECLLPEFKNLTVRRNPLRMEVEKNDERLAVNQLSDGEKCLMALVGDLARRMAIANPVRENPLDGEGVIMIDEIDLHLHPKWQRMIIPKLLEVFPHCQFLVSTHSPHIITHVQPENLFLLDQTKKGIVAERPSESYGKNVDRVLEDLMGLETTRPEKVQKKIHAIFLKINEGNLEKAQQAIDKMKKEIGADPELTKAEVLIRRREIIGK